MKHFYLLFLLIILIMQENSFSQDTCNANYFRWLKTELLKNKDIKEVKLYQKKYSNDRTRFQRMFVKLNSDSSNRWWLVGNAYSYYKNGQLGFFYKCDIQTFIKNDTAVCLDEKGDTLYIEICDNSCGTYEICLLTFGGLSVFNKFFMKSPLRFTRIEYINNKKSCVMPYDFDENGLSFLHGNVINYNSDGSVNNVKKYVKGKVIKN